jgi:hypothetical protein
MNIRFSQVNLSSVAGLVLVVLALASPTLSIAQPLAIQKKASEPQMVPFCQLLAHPAQYDKKIVRTKATLFSGIDTEVLRDLNCDYDSAWMRANCSRQSCDSIYKALDGPEFKPGAPINIEVVGKFLAYNEHKRNHRFVMYEIKAAKPASTDDFRKSGAGSKGMSLGQRPHNNGLQLTAR